MAQAAFGKLSFRPTADQELVTDLDGLKDQLARDGVAILHNVLRPEDCQMMQDGMWDALEYTSQDFHGVRRYKTRGDEPIVPLKRDDRDTWRNFQHFFSMHNMLRQNDGVGSSAVCFNVRTLPAVYAAYEKIYGVKGKDLISSQDGFAVRLPYEKDPRFVREMAPWLHTDHAFHPKERSRYSVQSWVTAFDVGPQDATFAFLKGSHKFHKEFAIKFGLLDVKEDWYKMQTREEVDFFLERGCELMRVQCPAGAQVLWDSKTMHFGIGPVGGKQDSIRMVMYCCYVPRSWATKHNLKRKREVFEDQKTTSHRPERVKCFSDKPRYRDKELQPVRKPEPVRVEDLSAVGRRMFGFD